MVLLWVCWTEHYCGTDSGAVHFTLKDFFCLWFPQCFAKAGKMEPNHLLNGFGPLQPAVAMLWWLQELQHNLFNDLQVKMSGLWLSPTINIWSVHWLSCSMPTLSYFLLIKDQSELQNFHMVPCPAWVLPASREINILTTPSTAVSKIAGGRRAARAISETQHSHVCVRMYGCLSMTPLKLTATGC